MSSLATRLADLATRIATECKSLRTLLNGNAADLTALVTSNKTNLVAAINEVKTALDEVATSVGAQINDGATTSTTETWSVDKILAELSDTATSVKNEILNGAGAAYDTLAELQALLEGDAADITSLMTSVGNRVRFDINTQGLDSTQKQNACTNIGAASLTQIGDPDTDLVSVFNTGLT